jgi:hypothetical protein
MQVAQRLAELGQQNQGCVEPKLDCLWIYSQLLESNAAMGGNPQLLWQNRAPTRRFSSSFCRRKSFAAGYTPSTIHQSHKREWRRLPLLLASLC